TVLRGELEATAQDPELDHQSVENIGSALEETERLSRIVDSLLAISRLDAGEAQMERKRLDLAELAVSTTEQMRLLADDRNIALNCYGNGRVEVEGDRARLEQVVVNLVDNAIKYTPEGGVVSVKVNTAGANAVMEVTDNGSGIPTKSLQHLFERFYRVDKARSRQMGGTGLGLAIVKSIVTAHGGQVTVESSEGSGSRFHVELPLISNSTLSRNDTPSIECLSQKKARRGSDPVEESHPVSKCIADLAQALPACARARHIAAIDQHRPGCRSGIDQLSLDSSREGTKDSSRRRNRLRANRLRPA